MAIVHARVDERLVHGQVAVVWTRMLQVSRIIVVNDEAVHDKIIIDGLKIAKPAGIKLSILSCQKAVEKILANEYEKDRVLLITKNIQDMKYLITHIDEIKSFNVGNIAKREGSIQIKNSVNLRKEDIDDILELLHKNVKITAQMVPSESDQSIENYLSNK